MILAIVLIVGGAALLGNAARKSHNRNKAQQRLNSIDHTLAWATRRDEHITPRPPTNYRSPVYYVDEHGNRIP